MPSSELAVLLGVSGGSVSTPTRELINPGVVTRVRVPGQRQDYFRGNMGAGALSQFIRMRVALTYRWTQLMHRGEALAEHKNPAVRRQLEEIRTFYEFLEVEQASILDRWAQLQKKRWR